MAETALSFRVTGRVQGVWFRAWTKERALALGLSGWVRNAEDGSVEGVVAGPEARVSEMVDALREGPVAARVDAVETAPGDAPREAGFQIAG